MRPITQKIRDELEKEKRMKFCVAFGKGFGYCSPKIEWDHVWIYAGRQINEKWAIVGICDKHHKAKEGNRLLKECIQRASLKLATLADLAKYPRRNWEQLKKSLGL